jgi:hypothetical protein
LAQVLQILLHLSHAMFELVVADNAVSQLIYLSAEPGKLSLDLGKTTGELSPFWRWAFAYLANLLGQLADVPLDLVEPLVQLHVFGGGTLLWPEHDRPVALMRSEPALLAQHRKRLPVRAHRDTITTGVLALSGKPVSRLKPPFLDCCSHVVSDLLVSGPWIAGVGHCHCTSLRCARSPGP